jgi:hypothetical protein
LKFGKQNIDALLSILHAISRLTNERDWTIAWEKLRKENEILPHHFWYFYCPDHPVEIIKRNIKEKLRSEKTKFILSF